MRPREGAAGGQETVLFLPSYWTEGEPSTPATKQIDQTN